MRAFIEAVDASDEEHGAAWLESEGYVLEWNGDGRLVFEYDDEDADDEAPPPVRYLSNVSVSRAVELWQWLATGEIQRLEREPWQPGNGYVLTPEREGKRRAWELESDRRFYDELGPERTDMHCRGEGCMRGAITHSVLCRAHHFEMIRHKPCPFQD
jgi:hypothetical protein